MRYNSMVSGHPKSIGIPQVDGLSTGPSNLGRHIFKILQLFNLRTFMILSVIFPN